MASNNESLSNAERALRVPIHTGTEHFIYTEALDEYSAKTLQRLKGSGVEAEIDEIMARSHLHLTWNLEEIPFSHIPLIGLYVRADEVSDNFYQCAIDCVDIAKALDGEYIGIFMCRYVYGAIASLETLAKQRPQS